MKKMVCIAAVLGFLMFSSSVFADSVRGHWKDTNRDGVKDTWVDPYQRSSPNNTRTDNYNYPGNYNPNSGRTTPQSKSPSVLYPTNPNPYNSNNPYE